MCGNSGADKRHDIGFYGGENRDQPIDWFDRTNTHGFVEVIVSREKITVNFLSSEGGIFETITKEKCEEREL